MIDEEITYREKGYRSTDLSYGSGKPLWAVCDNCGYGRWVIFQQYHDLCHKCANKNKPMQKCETPTKKRDCIDDDITYAEKGYRSTELKTKSNKPVWRVCAVCGEGSWIRFCAYRDLCAICAKNRKYNYDGYKDIVRSIDEDKTYEEKGYRITDLSAQSNKEVYAVCTECGDGRWVVFQAYRDLCGECARKTDEKRRKVSEFAKMRIGDKNSNWKGGISLDDYCKFFDEPLKDAIRNYFDNKCFNCDGDVDKNRNKNMSVHHVNYQKDCGCDNTQFCIYVPLCMSCHATSNGNRWYWYSKFMTDIAVMNPNYYAYHIPVVYYDEPSYNYAYVFEKQRKKR